MEVWSRSKSNDPVEVLFFNISSGLCMQKYVFSSLYAIARECTARESIHSNVSKSYCMKVKVDFTTMIVF